MKNQFLLLVVAVCCCTISAYSGDDASGSTPFEVDLSEPYHAYEMTPADKKWSKSLVHNLHYLGQVVHFVKTDIKLSVHGDVRQGKVYHALEASDYFYIVPSDAMLIIGAPHPYSSGINGFSMHRSKSGDFIVCLNLQPGGVPIHSGAKVIIGKNNWNGRLWSRF